MAWDPDAVAREPAQWSEHVLQSLERQRGAVAAYLQWRREQLCEAMSDGGTPAQVILRMRLYRILPPGNPRIWDPVVEMPAARLRLAADGGAVLEAHNSARDRWESLGEDRP
jgi:hypothetical protein